VSDRQSYGGPVRSGSGAGAERERERNARGEAEGRAVIGVLVVDDDPMVARLHSALVQRVPGFTVTGVAHSGGAALDAVRELRPELVLLDIYLPDMPGIEVLRTLRGDATAPEQGPDVLVVTAARDAETVRGAQRGGAVQYIIKPFEGQLLQERLRGYAERRAELAALSDPGQRDVDRLFGGSADGLGAAARTGGTHGAGGAREPAAAPALPKGLTEQTVRLVRGTLAAAPEGAGLSASECAERSGLSRVSARRYLEYFVATGTARVTLRYGTTGRPERRYHRREPAEGSQKPGHGVRDGVSPLTDNP
jgi:response regulator of citrate/malate metabolism